MAELTTHHLVGLEYFPDGFMKTELHFVSVWFGLLQLFTAKRQMKTCCFIKYFNIVDYFCVDVPPPLVALRLNLLLLCMQRNICPRLNLTNALAAHTVRQPAILSCCSHTAYRNLSETADIGQDGAVQ